MSQTAEEFRIHREQVLEDLLHMYCSGMHGSDGLCPECTELLEYAKVRIGRCPNNLTHTPCCRCPCPCYSDEMRERMKEAMRYCRPYLRRHPLINWRFRFA